MKVKKDLIGIGSAMLVWFVILVILGSILEPYIVAFWSILGFSIVFLALGVVVSEKKGS